MVEAPLCPICEERPANGYPDCAVCGSRVCSVDLEKYDYGLSYENEFGNEVKSRGIVAICCECSIGEWMSDQLMREGVVDIEIYD